MELGDFNVAEKILSALDERRPTTGLSLTTSGL